MIPRQFVDFYGDQTRWFIGRVVDLQDPMELGRIKVRIFGVHSEDTQAIPTDDLPWAQVVVPITEGGTFGLGNVLGINEGAHVFGMFLDGANSQLPLIIGSLPKLEDYSQGGRSTNVLAREYLAEEHKSRITRKKNRLDESGEPLTYATARPAKVTSVAPDRSDAYYAENEWEELKTDSDFSIYPYNQVKETAGGHVEEIDDTEGARRYHRYHPSGSYEEVIEDGSRTVKIIGKDYELILDGKNIFIDGDLNVTVTGTKRELIQGNYHLEVQGDMTMNLHQSLQTKIELNQETEVGKYRVTNVVENDNLTVLNGDQNLNIVTGSRIENITTDDTRTVQGNVSLTNYGTNTTVSVGDMAVAVASGTLTTTATGIITLGTTSNMVFDIDGTHTVTAAVGAVNYTAGDVEAAGISLTSHVHSGVQSGPSNTGGPL
jgi:hypothetical protein